MRINVDGSALRDPRVKFLAIATGLDRFGVLGRLLEVWGLCYDRVSANLPAAHIDAVAEHTGFAVAMVAAELAVDAGGLIRVCGAERRITYLQGQAERGRSGGLARVKQTLGGRLSEPVAVAKPSGSGSPPDLDHLRIPERESGTAAPAALVLVPMGPAKPDPAAELAAVAVDAINAATGRAFEARSLATLRLARALVKAGATHDDVRTVVRAKAAEWGADPKMAARVCPGTLLAADNFARYLDEARAGPAVARGAPINGRPRALGQAHVSPTAVHVDGDQAL